MNVIKLLSVLIGVGYFAYKLPSLMHPNKMIPVPRIMRVPSGKGAANPQMLFNEKIKLLSWTQDGSLQTSVLSEKGWSAPLEISTNPAINWAEGQDLYFLKMKFISYSRSKLATASH